MRYITKVYTRDLNSDSFFRTPPTFSPILSITLQQMFHTLALVTCHPHALTFAH